MSSRRTQFATRGRTPLRRLASGLLVLLLPAVGAYRAAGEDGSANVPSVVVGRPAPTTARTIELPGSFEPWEDAMLYAKVTGYASKVRVNIGERVQAGQALVELDIPEMDPEVERARADVASAEAQLRVARAEAELAAITFRRLSELHAEEPMAVMRQDVDVAHAERQVAEARVDAAAAELQVDRANLARFEALMAYSVIRAPFDGIVVRRLAHPGDLVVSGSDGGDPVLEVARDDRLRLVLAVPEAIAGEMKEGLKASIQVDSVPGQTFEGFVTRFSGLLTPDTRVMRTEIDMDDHDGTLRPGMYATVRLELADPNAKTLSVPASIIRMDGDGTFVWTLQDGVATKTAVKVVRDDGDRAVIAAGLEPDSLVVLAAPRDLREGQAVRIQSEEAPR